MVRGPDVDSIRLQLVQQEGFLQALFQLLPNSSGAQAMQHSLQHDGLDQGPGPFTDCAGRKLHGPAVHQSLQLLQDSCRT